MATGGIGNAGYGDQTTDDTYDNEGVYGYAAHPYPQYQYASTHEDDPLLDGTIQPPPIMDGRRTTDNGNMLPLSIRERAPKC